MAGTTNKNVNLNSFEKETTWNDKFIKWYSEYTAESNNRGYLQNIEALVRSLPDEYCEFIEKTTMGVDGASRDFRDYVDVRNAQEFGNNLNKAVADRDPRSMEAVLIDIVNGNATVRDPQAALNYFETEHGFEMEFAKDAIDPAAERREKERLAQASLDKYTYTLGILDNCKDLQERIIASMDARRPVERERKLRELEDRRADDHREIARELRFHRGLGKLFKGWSMRYEAYRARKQDLALYDERDATLRKYELNKLKDIKNMQKQLMAQGADAAITKEFAEEVEERQSHLLSMAFHEGILTREDAPEPVREAAQEDTRVSLADRLDGQLGARTTVQTPATERSERSEPTVEVPTVDEPEAEHE